MSAPGSAQPTTAGASHGPATEYREFKLVSTKTALQHHVMRVLDKSFDIHKLQMPVTLVRDVPIYDSGQQRQAALEKLRASWSSKGKRAMKYRAKVRAKARAEAKAKKEEADSGFAGPVDAASAAAAAASSAQSTAAAAAAQNGTTPANETAAAGEAAAKAAKEGDEAATGDGADGADGDDGSDDEPPKPKADMTQVAPFGQTTRQRNPQSAFKPKSKTMFWGRREGESEEEDENGKIAELRGKPRGLDMDRFPWVLSDYENQSQYTGNVEGGQNSNYVLFVFTDDGFRVLPASKWYKFTPKRAYRKLNIDEAEAVMRSATRGGYHSQRWIMRADQEKEEAAAAAAVAAAAGGGAGGAAGSKSTSGALAPSGSGLKREVGIKREGKPGSDGVAPLLARPGFRKFEEKVMRKEQQQFEAHRERVAAYRDVGEDMDYEEEFADDEVVNLGMEDSEARREAEFRQYGLAGRRAHHDDVVSEDEAMDDAAVADAAAPDGAARANKKIKRALLKLDNNDAYESDEENPYVSGDEEGEGDSASSSDEDEDEASGDDDAAASGDASKRASQAGTAGDAAIKTEPGTAAAAATDTATVASPAPSAKSSAAAPTSATTARPSSAASTTTSTAASTAAGRASPSVAGSSTSPHPSTSAPKRKREGLPHSASTSSLASAAGGASAAAAKRARADRAGGASGGASPTPPVPSLSEVLAREKVQRRRQTGSGSPNAAAVRPGSASPGNQSPTGRASPSGKASPASGKASPGRGSPRGSTGGETPKVLTRADVIAVFKKLGGPATVQQVVRELDRFLGVDENKGLLREHLHKLVDRDRTTQTMTLRAKYR
ncbi:hypothetical protein CXG81DRAFT_23901 [Caulochytrium protostelioides]|uniref:Uncharacterized protein n=1 Tax=Caulochytrium protostelioides TaxID=1555241 RepID=A0A4P9XDC5_9FUNG|nr:hypothetical protein CXG81DRAFT_23901 [Caulochytrium protostelioides]|eukprot:RKP03504.1 hypothetical protein CXG81DRAFT_23901 [Caulochytrium protostelioides]